MEDQEIKFVTPGLQVQVSPVTTEPQYMKSYLTTNNMCGNPTLWPWEILENATSLVWKCFIYICLITNQTSYKLEFNQKDLNGLRIKITKW